MPPDPQHQDAQNGDAQNEDAAAGFEPLRPRLTRIAHRMLGSRAEAEDMVQEAFLRWHRTDRTQVADATGFLVRTVTRLCLDLLRSARVRREQYIGPWLPEPVVGPETEDEEIDVTTTLMLALERLSPPERAAFLLHDVFGVGFDEIAATLEKSPEACRQLASRARRRVRDAKPRYRVGEAEGRGIAEAFFRASRSGDAAALASLLAGNVAMHTDGGGNARAAFRVLTGAEEVTRVLTRLAERWSASPSVLVAQEVIDGLPGFVTLEPDDMLQTTALEIADGRIAAIYVQRNPKKLRHLGQVFGPFFGQAGMAGGSPSGGVS